MSRSRERQAVEPTIVDSPRPATMAEEERAIHDMMRNALERIGDSLGMPGSFNLADVPERVTQKITGIRSQLELYFSALADIGALVGLNALRPEPVVAEVKRRLKPKPWPPPTGPLVPDAVLAYWPGRGYEVVLESFRRWYISGGKSIPDDDQPTHYLPMPPAPAPEASEVCAHGQSSDDTCPECVRVVVSEFPDSGTVKVKLRPGKLPGPDWST